MTFQTKLRGVFDNCDCTVLTVLQKLFLLFITLKVISHFLQGKKARIYHFKMPHATEIFCSSYGKGEV